MFYLTEFDNIISNGLWIIPKTASANWCKPIHDIINYSIFICPFESGMCGKEGRKLQNVEFLENEKRLLNEIKSTFHSFWGTAIWWNNTKIADTIFKNVQCFISPQGCK